MKTENIHETDGGGVTKALPEWQPIETAPEAIQGLARMRREAWGNVVELAGSQMDGSMILFGHHSLTNEVQQWIIIPPLRDRPGTNSPKGEA